eukprot:g71661.t1
MQYISALAVSHTESIKPIVVKLTVGNFKLALAVHCTKFGMVFSVVDGWQRLVLVILVPQHEKWYKRLFRFVGLGHDLTVKNLCKRSFVEPFQYLFQFRARHR